MYLMSVASLTIALGGCVVYWDKCLSAMWECYMLTVVFLPAKVMAPCREYAACSIRPTANAPCG